MKLVVPMMAAWYLSRYYLPPTFPRVMTGLVIVLLPMFLIIQQPDLGTSLLVGMAGIFVFLFARLGLEGMANNWSSAELGIDWWHDAGTSTPLSDMAPALVLACVLGALATILRRGAQLEEDVEGLV